MIPRTGMSTAALAIAKTAKPFGMPSSLPPYLVVRHLGMTVEDAQRARDRAERRELVAGGFLPGSSAYAHAVPLAVDLVGLVVADSGPPALLDDAVERALNATATGAYELWFNDVGDAYLSFELEGDAVLFRLALDA